MEVAPEGAAEAERAQALEASSGGSARGCQASEGRSSPQGIAEAKRTKGWGRSFGIGPNPLSSSLVRLIRRPSTTAEVDGPQPDAESYPGAAVQQPAEYKSLVPWVMSLSTLLFDGDAAML